MWNQTFKMIIKLNFSISIQIWMNNKHLAISNQWKNSLKIIKEVGKSWGMKMIKILNLKWKKLKVWQLDKSLPTDQDLILISWR